jgi:hypothetical protein
MWAFIFICVEAQCYGERETVKGKERRDPESLCEVEAG